MLFGLLDNPIVLLSLVLALVIGISVHEFSHAWIALLLGDPTAKYQGRVTLDPRAHIDPMGMIVLFLAGFGWGRPVQINPQYFARPVLDEILVALSGPASNFVMAVILSVIIKIIGPINIFAQLLAFIIQINLMLMVFNFLPVPPLDGSKILKIFMSEESFRMLELYSLPLLVILIIALNSTGLGDFIFQLVNNLTSFLIGN